MTLGCESDDGIVGEIQLALSGPSMRIYLSHDLQGVELGGCLKNVYAIAAGCCQGLALGDNALAALLTRALAEMVRVGVALGARMETFYGLSGFGDLVATCHGEWSRNRTFGEAIARGKSAREIISSQRTAVEGYRTSRSFYEMLSQKGIEALYSIKSIGFSTRTNRPQRLWMISCVGSSKGRLIRVSRLSLFLESGFDLKALF